MMSGASGDSWWSGEDALDSFMRGCSFSSLSFLPCSRMRSQHCLCHGPRLAFPSWGLSPRTWRTCTAATRYSQAQSRPCTGPSMPCPPPPFTTAWLSRAGAYRLPYPSPLTEAAARAGVPRGAGGVHQG